MPITPGGFGLTMKSEIITMTINNTVSGNMQVQGSASFNNNYNNSPCVIFSHWTQADPYCDVILEPFIFNVTTTNFQCKFTTADLNNGQNYFGTGIMIAQFFVIGN